MAVSPLGAAVVASAVLALAALAYLGDPGRWREHLGDRLCYGIPWGTAITVALVVAFYLVAQTGWRHWDDPLVYPFVTWSYFYPTGLLTAGIAHGSPAHLLSNMAGTLAVAPIVEYAWSHYPSGRRRTAGEPGVAGDGGAAGGGGLLARPWVRAVVVFPAALLAVAFLTSLFSLGPSLGFSGAVFALLGFAVVTFPLTTVVGVVGASAIMTVFDAVGEPVVEATVEAEPPAPPSWAGIAFQAHALGFLLGALAGLWLLSARGRRPAVERTFVGVLLIGMVQSLWLIALSGGEDTYVLYRGHGVVFVFFLTVLLAVAVAGSDRPLPRPLSRFSRRPSRRQLAVGWLALLAIGLVLGVAGALVSDEPAAFAVGLLVVLALLLALPALPPLVPDRWIASPVSRRGAATGLLAGLTVLVAVVALPLGFTVVDGAPAAGDGAVDVGDYAVSYEENVTSGREFVFEVPATNESDEQRVSGVILASDDRELWTLGAWDYDLEYQGNETVTVGGIGWRETVHVERVGWTVTGNETTYAVDLEADGERTRSFRSDPATVAGRIEGHRVAVAPTEDGFEVRVADDETVERVPIPATGESADAGPFRVATETVAGTDRVFVETGDTRIQIAERETY